MKNIRPLNTNLRILAPLFVVCSLLFLPGCRNLMEPQNIKENDTEKGILFLTITEQGTGRTIRPEISLNDFISFSLKFVARDSGNTAYATWTDGSGKIGLLPGTWDLHITAYMLGDEKEPLRPAASGSRLGIKVPSGETVAGNVELSPIRGGSGTFSWGNVRFPESTITATMEITRVDEGTEPFSQAFYFVGGTTGMSPPSSGYLPLPGGQYRVIFTLCGKNGERMVVSAILHIYQNMESILPVAFIPSDFPSSLLDIVLDSWTGSYWDFVGNGITTIYFDLLGIEGMDVNASNFNPIVGWLNKLSTSFAVPNDMEGFKVLVDAALVGIESGDIWYSGNYGHRASAQEAIADLIRNGSEVMFEWSGFDTVMVHIGDYEVEIVFDNDLPILVPRGSLAHQLAWLQEEAQDGNLYLVEIIDDESIAPSQTILPTGRSDLTIILRGRDRRHIVSLSSNGNLFSVGSGVTLVLDNNVTLMGIDQDNFYPLIQIGNGGTLIMEGGSEVMGNDGGGGVHITNGATFIMEGGEIFGNQARGIHRSGGVYVTGSGATFTMNSGKIFDNVTRSFNNGSGVHISNGATFTMSGGKIFDNEDRGSDSGGGVHVTGGGATFIMNGGEIFGNETASGSGGGVRVSNGATFTMEDGEIFGNRATGSSGGGVHITGSGATFIMNGGEISGNEASVNSGGGVHVTGGGATFTMNGGEISGNETFSSGGGVRVTNGAIFTMEGGEISGNRATGMSSGGGVHVTGSGSTFIMSGGKIFGNRATAGSSGGGVHVTGNYATFIMTGGEIFDNETTSGGGGVHVTGGGSTFIMSGGEISGNSTTSMSSGGGVHVTGNYATFIMTGGEIFGNEATAFSSGGGVNVAGNATFTMEGGKIFNNEATSTSGGGVHVSTATFIMAGGEIFGNEATSGGGGVRVVSSGATAPATFTMTGGEIFGNKTHEGGGGVRIDLTAIFTMADGRIANNETTGCFNNGGGGGVFVVNGGTFIMEGGEVVGNEVTGRTNLGGGVAVVSSTFIMRGGEIFGNKASSDTPFGMGGGGLLASGGTIQISNGIIYGIDAEPERRNTITGSGHAAMSGIAQYGTFNDSGFTPLGTLNSTNYTIEVRNGELVPW